MQLHQVERVHAEVASRPVDPGPEVLRPVVLRQLLHPPAHLGGHGEIGVGVVREEPAEDLLAAAVAVDIGGVVERDPRLCRGLEDVPRRVLGHVAPVGAELPGAEADRGDRSSGPSESSLLHVGSEPFRG